MHDNAADSHGMVRENVYNFAAHLDLL